MVADEGPGGHPHMMRVAWLTALRLFVSLWTRALHFSAKLSPANWERVVVVCLCLLIASFFLMLRDIQPTKERVPAELANTRQLPQLEVRQQPQQVAQQSTSGSVRKTNYPNHSKSTRIERRARTNWDKRNYRISDQAQIVIWHNRTVVPTVSVEPWELNIDSRNSCAETAAKATLKEKIQTTPVEAADNILPGSNPMPDQTKASVEQFEPPSDLVSAKTEPDTTVLNHIARTYSPGYIRAKMYVGELPINTVDDSGLKPDAPPESKFANDNTGGFTVQTWDIACKSLFGGDVTSKSRRPFGIPRGTPASSIHILAGHNDNRIKAKRFYKDGMQEDFDLAQTAWSYPLQETRTEWPVTEWKSDFTNELFPEPLFLRGNSQVLETYRYIHFASHNLSEAFQVRTSTDILAKRFPPLKFDVISSADFGNGFNYEDDVLFQEPARPDRTLLTVFTHDHAGPATNRQLAIYAGVLTRVFSSNSATPLLRAYQNDQAQVRVLVGAHEQSLQRRLFRRNARDSNSEPQPGVDQLPLTKLHGEPIANGVTTDKQRSQQSTLQSKSEPLQSTSQPGFAALEPAKDLQRPVVPPGDKSVGILFWILLLNTLMNTLSTTSAIILAWISNHRAKAELVLKEAQALRDQAKALHEAKERDLRIRQLELQLAELQRTVNPPMIIVGN